LKGFSLKTNEIYLYVVSNVVCNGQLKLAEKVREQSKICRAKVTELKRKMAHESQQFEDTSILHP
jgi:hypothetical protein